MSFDKLNFTKNWQDPNAFPTIETDEAEVRADMQLLHDEARAAFNALIDALVSQTGAADIGAEQDGTLSTVQAILNSLLADKHAHADLSALEALVVAFAGMSLATTVTDDATKIPTSKAVLESMAAAGLGDMLRSVYDQQLRGLDVYDYADASVGAHANDTNNPHGVTLEQLGIGDVDNTADADKPISTAAQEALDAKVDMSAVIDVAHGGTGATTVAAARNALGLGKTSGALPVANGGTGATTVAAARNALGLGNTSGAVPVANGGTGASSASGARTNLGAMALSGGTFTGAVKFKGMRLTAGVDYGADRNSIANPVTGQLFFEKV